MTVPSMVSSPNHTSSIPRKLVVAAPIPIHYPSRETDRHIVPTREINQVMVARTATDKVVSAAHRDVVVSAQGVHNVVGIRAAVQISPLT